MESQLFNIEYFNITNNYWSQCTIKGIFGEKSFIVSSKSNLKSDEFIVPIEHLRKIISTNPISSTTSECEYEIKDYCYIPCKIKSQKGKFYSIIFDDEKTVKLIKESKLRHTTSSFFSTVIISSYSNIILPIPKELTNWFGSDSYNEMIKNIQEDPHDPVSFYINSFPEAKPNFIRVLCPKDKADLLKLIIDTAIENELKLTHLDNDKVTTLKQLKTVQALNKVFVVSNKFVGMLIGSRGSNIKYLSNIFHVTINVEKLNDNQNRVTISGNNEANVENCYIEMNLQEKIFEIKFGYEKTLREQSSQFINDYHLNIFYISNYDIQDDYGKWYHGPNIKIIGPEQYLNDLIHKIKYCIKLY